MKLSNTVYGSSPFDLDSTGSGTITTVGTITSPSSNTVSIGAGSTSDRTISISGTSVISGSTVISGSSFNLGYHSPDIEVSPEFLNGVLKALRKHPEIAKAFASAILVESTCEE